MNNDTNENNNAGNYRRNNNNSATVKSFGYTTRVTGSTPAHGSRLDAYVFTSVKYMLIFLEIS